MRGLDTLCILVACVAFCACGGGGSGTPPQEPPPTMGTLVLVNQSICGFVCFNVRATGSLAWTRDCDFADPLMPGETEIGEFPPGLWDLEIDDDAGICVASFPPFAVIAGQTTTLTIQ